jgi:two-component system chemotaxis response regulator CheB
MEMLPVMGPFVRTGGHNHMDTAAVLNATKPAPAPEGHDVIAIGGSAGAPEALISLIRDLPADLPAAVLVAIHRTSEGPELLAGILDSLGSLPAVLAEEGQQLEGGGSTSHRPTGICWSNTTTCMCAGARVRTARDPLSIRCSAPLRSAARPG